jgi:GT2 family glycosyltransferase
VASRRAAREAVERRVTVLVKTFQRPRTVNAAIASIRRFYPSIPIILADDSREPVAIEDNSVIVHRLPFDSGTAKGRNFLVSQARSEYFLMIDDDNVFTPDTRLGRMIESLEASGLDILSCLVLEGTAFPFRSSRARRRIVDFQMDLELENGTLRFMDPRVEHGRDYVRCDLVHQFFLARTDALRGTGGWDDRLKTADHTDFFLRIKSAGLKVGFTPLVTVNHEPLESERRSSDYAPYRHGRSPEFRRMWIETHGIERLVGRNGTVVSAEEFVNSTTGNSKLGNLVYRAVPPGLLLRHRWRAATAGMFREPSQRLFGTTMRNRLD